MAIVIIIDSLRSPLFPLPDTVDTHKEKDSFSRFYCMERGKHDIEQSNLLITKPLLPIFSSDMSSPIFK